VLHFAAARHYHGFSGNRGNVEEPNNSTGYNFPILKPAVSGRGVKISQKIPHSVTGEALDVKGLQKVTFLLNRHEYTHTF